MPDIRACVSAFAAALCCFLLTACGVHLNDPPSTALSPLTGNWLIAGQIFPFPGPQNGMSLTASLVVDGTQVTANGYFQSQCASSGFGATVSLSGKLAQDGSFTLTEPTSPGVTLSNQVSVSGRVPSAAGESWPGTYSIQSSAGGTGSFACNVKESASFIATPIPPLNGLYTGPASSYSGTQGSLGANATLQLNVNQGEALLLSALPPGTSAPTNYIAGTMPLAATLAVAGSACFTSGSTGSSQLASLVEGNFFTLNLTMSDGSQMLMTGLLNDLNASAINVLYTVTGGQCDKSGGETTLTFS